jgi:hypothetical protein
MVPLHLADTAALAAAGAEADDVLVRVGSFSYSLEPVLLCSALLVVTP